MARIYPLFSSSRGNATYIGTQKEGILIDAGVSCKRLFEAFDRCGLEVSAVKAIFITHEHSDHVGGLSVFTKRTGIPVYARGRTLQYLLDGGFINSRYDEINSSIEAAGMEITPFDTPHDAMQSCGYRIITSDGKTCAVCTDLGHVAPEVERNLNGCELVMLESNYDEKMLKCGSYPEYLKKRIRSKHGHLSNSDCAAQLKKLVEIGTTRIILAHLSQENNTPQIAAAAAVSGLNGFARDKDYLLEVAPVETVGKCVVF